MVAANHLVSYLCKTSGSNKTNVSGAKYRDVHVAKSEGTFIGPNLCQERQRNDTSSELSAMMFS
jgi:hypothetical protein